MGISEKIRQARSAAELSQEAVAEKLGVSRQTISNWENGRSYPDIASVIVMSDVYGMTLDSLLKDDNEMIKHLTESTDVTRSNKQVIRSLILLMAMGVAYFLLLGFISNNVVLNVIPLAVYIAVMIVFCVRERGVNMFFLGLGIFLIFNALMIVGLGGEIIDYINFPSFMMILVPLLAVLTITRSYRVFWGGLRAAFSPKKEVPEDLRLQAASLFRLLSITALLAALISMLICCINIGFGMDFSNTEELLSTLAVNLAATVIPLYCALFLIAAVFEPVVFMLKRKSTS